MPKPSALRLVPEQAKLSEFDLFWECYPRPKNKLDALKAWTQVATHRPPIEELLGAVERLRAEGRAKEYIPYPATWLRAGGFLDED